MGAVSAFTKGNYHCKPLMTDVIVIHTTDVTVIHQVKHKWHFSRGIGPTNIKNWYEKEATNKSAL